MEIVTIIGIGVISLPIIIIILGITIELLENYYQKNSLKSVKNIVKKLNKNLKEYKNIKKSIDELKLIKNSSGLDDDVLMIDELKLTERKLEKNIENNIILSIKNNNTVYISKKINDKNIRTIIENNLKNKYNVSSIKYVNWEKSDFIEQLKKELLKYNFMIGIEFEKLIDKSFIFI